MLPHFSRRYACSVTGGNNRRYSNRGRPKFRYRATGHSGRVCQVADDLRLLIATQRINVSFEFDDHLLFYHQIGALPLGHDAIGELLGRTARFEMIGLSCSLITMPLW